MTSDTDAKALNKVFKHAAAGVLVEWGIEGELEDLTQDLWVWYLETESTQEKMAGLSEPERITTARRRAHQLLSRKVLDGNVSSGQVLYSTESVKQALSGESSNKYLRLIIPDALNALGARNEYQAEAIRSRYEDGLIPSKEGGGADALSHGIKSLTDEVNIMYLTSFDSSGTAVELRQIQGGHRDPTGELAIKLIERGDEEIELLDRFRQPRGSTTLRKEFERC